MLIVTFVLIPPSSACAA